MIEIQHAQNEAWKIVVNKTTMGKRLQILFALFSTNTATKDEDERKSLGEPISTPQLKGTMHDYLDAPQSSFPIVATQKGKRKTPSKPDPVPNSALVSQHVVVAPAPPHS